MGTQILADVDARVSCTYDDDTTSAERYTALVLTRMYDCAFEVLPAPQDRFHGIPTRSSGHYDMRWMDVDHATCSVNSHVPSATVIMENRLSLYPRVHPY